MVDRSQGRYCVGKVVPRLDVLHGFLSMSELPGHMIAFAKGDRECSCLLDWKRI